MITVDRLRERLDYDAETGIFRWKATPSRQRLIGKVAGSIASCGYRIIHVEGQRHYAQRLAWLHFYGEWPPSDIDHANGNKDDNRIANLRSATRGQNCANARLRKDNTTGFRGVYIEKKRFIARIKHQGRQKRLGVFATAEEAAAAHFRALRAIYGEFAAPAHLKQP